MLGKAVAACLVVVMCGLVFASCGSDDDEDGDIDVPAYGESAAKYMIDGNGSPYESVEFTEGGNYIIKRSDVADARPAYVKAADKSKVRLSLLARNLLRDGKTTTQTRAGGDNSPIIYGKYTKKDNDTYLLGGFGTVKVTADGTGNAYSLEIARTGGQTVTYKATRRNANLNSSMSNRLCRTWSLDGLRFYIKCNDQTLVELSGKDSKEIYAKLREWAMENDPEYDQDDWDYIESIADEDPKQLVFTKNGTYVIFYADDDVDVSSWRWYDKEETIMQYSWINDFDDEDSAENGQAYIAFDGNQLLITEKEVEADSGMVIETGVTYVMNEVK